MVETFSEGDDEIVQTLSRWCGDWLEAFGYWVCRADHSLIVERYMENCAAAGTKSIGMFAMMIWD